MVEISVNPLALPEVECSDETDNDNDGFIDLDDPGCSFAQDASEIDELEIPVCNDGVDNGGDCVNR